MKVVLSVDAEADLESISDRIALDDATIARRFVGKLLNAARGIGALPRGYPVLPGYETRGIRRRVVGSYLILYRIDSDRITVVRIIHGSRDYTGLLAQDS